MAKSVFNGGYLGDFKKSVTKLQKRKGKFKVISYGLTRHLIFENEDGDVLKKKVYYVEAHAELPWLQH